MGLAMRAVGPRLRLDFDTKDVYHDVSVSQATDGFCLDEDEMSSADSADIIAQAKNRLRSLDKEAHVSTGRAVQSGLKLQPLVMLSMQYLWGSMLGFLIFYSCIYQPL